MSNAVTEPIYQARYRHGVDEKRRVQIPAKWRPSAEGVELALVLWPHHDKPDACLLVLPPRAFADFVQKITAMPFGDPKAEALRRILGEKSDRVPIDKAGRICLPEEFARAAGITSEAFLVGMFDRYQIWNPERYEQTKAVVEALAPDAFRQF
jgi:MraZ protein